MVPFKSLYNILRLCKPGSENPYTRPCCFGNVIPVRTDNPPSLKMQEKEERNNKQDISSHKCPVLNNVTKFTKQLHGILPWTIYITDEKWKVTERKV